MKWFILILGVCSNASASILIKMAMSNPTHAISLSNPLSIFLNYYLLSGIALYGGAFFVYAVSLTYFPLNIAHPVLTSGTIAIVSVMSCFLFKEPFYWSTILGVFMVAAGVFLITAKYI